MLSDKDKVISLSSFNADLVTAYFFVAPTKLAELTAMRFMYKIMQDEIPINAGKAVRSREIADTTIEKIEFRYDLYRHHAEYFFRAGKTVNHDALAIAVICDEYVNHGNEPLALTPEEDEAFAPQRCRDDGFDDAVLCDACSIWEEACELAAHGMPDEEYPSQESLFLAHINAMENLRTIEESFDAYTYEELSKIIGEDFPKVRDFICTHTMIGEDLAEFLDDMEGRIHQVLTPPPAPPPPRGGHLRLISADPTP